MAKSDVERVTEEKVAKGGVLVKFYFDMQHNEKDKLQPLLTNLINEQLMKEPGVVYVFGSIEEPLEKEGVYITSAMVTVLFENFLPLLGIAFRYAPAGIEILKPEKEMRFKTSELQAILTEMSMLSSNYAKFILEKVMKPEDVENIKKMMETRAEVGKRFLEKKDEEKDKKE